MKVRIIAKIKNEHFYSARKEAGFKFMTDLALVTGIRLQTLYGYENFKSCPRNRRGDEFIDRIIALETALNKNIEELFPPEYKIAVDNKLRSKIEFIKHTLFLPNERELMLLPATDDPEEKMIKTELREELEKQLNLLTPRERRTLKWRFGLGGPELTVWEIGDKLKVGAGRIRQIEAKALRKLKHPRGNKTLRAFSDVR